MQNYTDNSLLKLQRQFKETLKTETAQVEGIQDTPPISISTRIGIYRYAYWARIEESLQEDFPMTQERLGEERFLRIVRAYLFDSPSTFASLAEVSAGLPEYLSRMGLDDEILNLAKVEWYRILSSLAEDVPSNLSDISKLQEADLNQLRFYLSESVFFTPETIVYQSKGVTQHEPLSEKEKILLEAIRKDKTLQEIYQLASENAILEEESARFFQSWTEKGIIRGFKI